jgi:hypothetical protein
VGHSRPLCLHRLCLRASCIALYLALKELNKNLMVLATAFVGLFVVLDLAVTWSHYASVLTLYRNYAIATDDAHRASYIAAANYASAMLNSPLEIVYAIVTLAAGILLIGFVMLRGVFNKNHSLFGLGHRCPRAPLGYGLQPRHNRECPFHHSLALFCGQQTLPARSRVIRVQAKSSVVEHCMAEQIESVPIHRPPLK